MDTIFYILKEIKKIGSYTLFEIIIPLLRQCLEYASQQAWWPGFKFLSMVLIVTYFILKLIQSYFIKHQTTSNKNHTNPQTKSKKAKIYPSANARMNSIPKKYSKNSTNFISSTNFLKYWKPFNNNGRMSDGYKNDYSTSGCYLILISDKKSTPSTILNSYTEIYAGQSVNIANRVHQHFTGHGNGDVYADVKYGKYVFVKLFPCPKSDMNDLECRLIESFNGLQSYNRTAGGSKKRKKEWGEIFVSF